MKYYIAIPTYNGGDIWREVVSNIKSIRQMNCLFMLLTQEASIPQS